MCDSGRIWSANQNQPGSRPRNSADLARVGALGIGRIFAAAAGIRLPLVAYSLFIRLSSIPWNTRPVASRRTAEFSCLRLRSSLGCGWRAIPRAGALTERVIDAVEDGLFLANQLYDKALLRYGQGNVDFRW